MWTQISGSMRKFFNMHIVYSKFRKLDAEIHLCDVRDWRTSMIPHKRQSHDLIRMPQLPGPWLLLGICVLERTCIRKSEMPTILTAFKDNGGSIYFHYQHHACPCCTVIFISNNWPNFLEHVTSLMKWPAACVMFIYFYFLFFFVPKFSIHNVIQDWYPGLTHSLFVREYITKSQNFIK